MFILLPIIFLAIYLEVTFTTLPLLLVVLIIMVILNKEAWAAAAGFFGGLIIDAAAVRTLGTTSIFLVLWLFFILLYERKYEINSVPFAGAVSFAGPLLYLLLIRGHDVLIQSVICAVAGIILLISFRYLFLSKRREARLNY